MTKVDTISKATSDYQCALCDKHFSSNSHLRRHEATHSRSRLHKCAFCDRSFVRHDVLRRHSRSCCQRKESDTVATATPGRRPLHVPVAHNPAIRFLFHYTDPSRASICEAFGLAAAHAQSAGTLEDDRQEPSLVSGYMTGIFGMFSDVLVNAGDYSSFEVSPPAVAFADTTSLQTRAEELRHLLYVHCERQQTRCTDERSKFLGHTAKAVFTARNFKQFITAYFDTFHPQHPFIHRPTFKSDRVSLPLLLATVFAGSVHCAPKDDVLATSLFFDIGEDYIFSCLKEISSTPDTASKCVMEVVQAALLIIALQGSINNESTRHRIRTNRSPELFAVMRELGMFRVTASVPLVMDEWDRFVLEEERIRTAHVAFLMDCMNTFFFNSAPQITLAEIDLRLPYADELFDVPEKEDFLRLSASDHHTAARSYYIERVLGSLLKKKALSTSDSAMLAFLQPRHLMICIFALHSIIFSARSSLLLESSYSSLNGALRRWKEIWDHVHTTRSIEGLDLIGFTKYADELWWITSKVLELSRSGGLQTQYMKGSPTDSLRGLHEFIKTYARQ